MRREFSVLSLSFFVGIMLTPFAILSFVVIILVASTITKKKERASCSVCRTRELFIEASCAQSEANETDEKREKNAFATTGRYAIQMNVLRMLKRRIENGKSSLELLCHRCCFLFGRALRENVCFVSTNKRLNRHKQRESQSDNSIIFIFITFIANKQTHRQRQTHPEMIPDSSR